METGYIREFVMLADCLNFSEAAERLFISQSSLSKHIRALERELGGELFVRTTRTIRLSEMGTVYLPYARKIADLCDQAEVRGGSAAPRRRVPDHRGHAKSPVLRHGEIHRELPPGPSGPDLQHGGGGRAGAV